MREILYPDVGPAVPRRGNAFSRWLGRRLLNLIGWRMVGEFPNERKCILLGAPHTSNFDVVLALGGMLDLGINLNVMVKDNAFKGPWAGVFRWFGALPIDRSKSTGMVEQTVETFKRADHLLLVIMGEGTRKAPEKWKTGFYHIAAGAQIPLVPCVLRYDLKVLEFKPPFHPSGDFAKDWPLLLAQFKDGVPRYPERLSKPLADLQGKPWRPWRGAATRP